MRVFYVSWSRNFGDALNAWLWDALLGSAFRERHPEVLFVGVGTTLHDRVPRAERTVVFGTGCGYFKPPRPDDSWSFYCVRGPKTARRLGLEPAAAVTDAALLARLALPEGDRPREGVAYLPHCKGALVAPWRRIAAAAGCRYIDPFADSREVIERIRRCELVITEAMHGAILADAYGVPWIPVACYPWINRFKWLDWTRSVGLSYQPFPLAPVVPPRRVCRRAARRLTRLSFEHRRRPARRTPVYEAAYGLMRGPAAPWYRRNYTRAIEKIAHLREHGRPRLSAPARRDELLKELETRLDRFRREWL